MLVAAVVMAFVPNIYNTFVEERTEIVGESVSDYHIRDIAAQEAAKIQPGVTREYVDGRVADCQSVTNNKYIEIQRDVQGCSQKVADAARVAADTSEMAGNVLVIAADAKRQSGVAVSVAEKAKHHSHWFLVLGSICGLFAVAILVTVAVRQRRKQRGNQTPRV